MRLWTTPQFSCGKYLFKSALLCPPRAAAWPWPPNPGQQLTDASPPRDLALPLSCQNWISTVNPRCLGAKPAHLLITRFIHAPPHPHLCPGEINKWNEQTPSVGVSRALDGAPHAPPSVACTRPHQVRLFMSLVCTAEQTGSTMLNDFPKTTQ